MLELFDGKDLSPLRTGGIFFNGKKIVSTRTRGGGIFRLKRFDTPARAGGIYDGRNQPQPARRDFSDGKDFTPCAGGGGIFSTEKI